MGIEGTSWIEGDKLVYRVVVNGRAVWRGTVPKGLSGFSDNLVREMALKQHLRMMKAITAKEVPPDPRTMTEQERKLAQIGGRLAVED